jgi:centrosomal protein CEP41
MSKYSVASSAGDQIVAKKKSELFKRIKCSTLNKLINEQPSQPESIYGLVDENKEDIKEDIKDEASEYSVQTGISQQTGISAITVATQDLGLNVSI